VEDVEQVVVSDHDPNIMNEHLKGNINNSNDDGTDHEIMASFDSGTDNAAISSTNNVDQGATAEDTIHFDHTPSSGLCDPHGKDSSSVIIREDSREQNGNSHATLNGHNDRVDETKKNEECLPGECLPSVLLESTDEKENVMMSSAILGGKIMETNDDTFSSFTVMQPENRKRRAGTHAYKLTNPFMSNNKPKKQRRPPPLKGINSIPAQVLQQDLSGLEFGKGNSNPMFQQSQTAFVANVLRSDPLLQVTSASILSSGTAGSGAGSGKTEANYNTQNKFATLSRIQAHITSPEGAIQAITRGRSIQAIRRGRSTSQSAKAFASEGIPIHVATSYANDLYTNSMARLQMLQRTGALQPQQAFLASTLKNQLKEQMNQSITNSNSTSTTLSSGTSKSNDATLRRLDSRKSHLQVAVVNTGMGSVRRIFKEDSGSLYAQEVPLAKQQTKLEILSRKQHQCQICKKCFTTNGSLRIHYRVHTGYKPHACPYCPKRFTQSGNLSTHIRTHTRERPFVCEICLKTFSHKSNLNSHIQTHSGERPFKCLECGKGFTRKNRVLSHMATHRKEEGNSRKTSDPAGVSAIEIKPTNK